MKKKKRVFLLIESSNSFGWEILRGITSYIRAQRNWIVDFEDYRSGDPIPADLLQGRWDGVIVLSILSPRPERLKDKLAYPCPVVELHGDNRTTEVRGDTEMILETLIDFFQGIGFVNIGFYSNFRSGWIEDRGVIFERLCRERELVPHLSPSFHLTPSPPFSLPNHWTRQDDEELESWLRTLPKPVALIGIFDQLAIQIIKACKRLGYSIPDETAVAGVGNEISLCGTISPSLSSIDICAFQVGYEAAKLLDGRMKGMPDPPLPILVPPSGFIGRDSTNPTASNDIIGKAIAMIRENALFGITVHDILEQLHYSPRTLERGIKNRIGRSPKAEIIRVRLEYAVRFLETTDLSVAEISKLAGFSSRSSFVTLFLKNFRKTPSQYRRERRNT